MTRLGLAFVLLSLPTASHNAGGWKEYHFKEHCFSALFPSQPIINAAKTPEGEIKKYGAELDKCVFMVAVGDYPDGRFENKADAELRLDLVVKASAGKLKHEKVSKITFGGAIPGREVWADGGDGNYLHARIFLVNGRLYQIIASGPKARSMSPEADKFLDSLVLTQ